MAESMRDPGSKDFRSRHETPVRAGLSAGSIAAVTATLISLPLHSPSDAFFNSATVAAGSLAAGIAAGVAWRLLSAHHSRIFRFALVWAIGFGMVAMATVAGETQLDRFVAFVLPLAAVAFTITGVLTPWFAGWPGIRQWWLMPAMLVIAVAVGGALAGQGDQESGRLELPPRATSSDVPSAIPAGSVIDTIVRS